MTYIKQNKKKPVITIVDSQLDLYGGQGRYALKLFKIINSCYDGFLVSHKNILKFESIRKLIRSNIIIINNPLNFLSFLISTVFIYKKKITIFHSKNYSDNFYKRIILNIRKKIYLLPTPYKGYLIFLTKSDKEYFSKIKKPYKKMKSFIISNSVNTEIFSVKKYNIKNKKFNILFVGKLTKSKGVFDIIEVAKKIEYKNIIFNFVGKADTKTIKILKKLNNCLYKGVLEENELKKVYINSDLFVLPSYSESFPSTILEAMASGLPILSTNIYGIKEILGKNNYLINPGDINSLKELIMHSYKNKKILITISKNNRKVIEKNFSDKVFSKRMLNLINNIIYE